MFKELSWWLQAAQFGTHADGGYVWYHFFHFFWVSGQTLVFGTAGQIMIEFNVNIQVLLKMISLDCDDHMTFCLVQSSHHKSQLADCLEI